MGDSFDTGEPAPSIEEVLEACNRKSGSPPILSEQQLNEALEQLPAKCQAAALLHYRDGLSFADVATRMGCSKDIVKQYIVQTLCHIRAAVERLRSERQASEAPVDG